MELLKMLSSNEIVAQVVSFLLLLFLLRTFFWKKILKVLDARRERIAADFAKIQDMQAQASQLKTDLEAKLSSIEETARQEIHEAREEAKKISEEAKKKANEEAQEIIETARTNIKFEMDKAKQELKDQIIDLTIKATEDIIQEKLTADNDKKLIEDFLRRVEKGNE
ncbi:MAG: F0F1 ATP synthase subunit B [Candidatus Omnitrophica bacterium]|nr:F0F1 ATP synthase subunit B [Candidatus Omnitrophota bacterium]MDD5653336.1 F0F1 ATP synthase subunit B [Candidatus Omnitrophota bacterium]